MQESREEIVAQVKERADIVQIIGECVDLKKSGARYLGLCPFHGEKTPSFSVHSGQQFYYCFGCGESGDVFSFMMKYHNLDFPSSLKELAGRYSITLPEKRRSPEQQRREQLRKQMFVVNSKVEEIYRTHLAELPAAAAGSKYLDERGITKAIREQFGLGYAPDVKTAGWDFLAGKLNAEEQTTALELGLLVKNDRGGTYDRFRDRILFPIHEISGRVCGFGGRIVGEGQPKYLNSPESLIYNKSKLLLGLYQQKEAIRKTNQAVIVEGNFDLISLVCQGLDQVVAPLGTALTREQLRLLRRYADDVVLLFDGDEAGVKAAIRSVPHFLAEQVAGRVALLPAEHDPDSYVREYGLAAIEKLLAEAESLPEFVFSQLVKQHGLTLDGKSKIVEELRPLVQAASSGLQRTVIISHFAGQLHLSSEELSTMLQRSTPQAHNQAQVTSRATPEQQKEHVTPLSQAQKRLVSFMILHPDYFAELEAQGVRACLEGSVGEVIFLQLKVLFSEGRQVEPEELLTVLPKGSERNTVASVLETAGEGDFGEGEEVSAMEASELLEWIRQESLQRSSAKILQQISDLQVSGDFSKLTGLLQEKQEIDRKLKGLEL